LIFVNGFNHKKKILEIIYFFAKAAYKNITYRSTCVNVITRN